MSNISDFSGLGLEELLFLKRLIEDESLQQELYSMLDYLLETKKKQNTLSSSYSSSRLPSCYETYRDQCSYLLSQFTIDDVPFLANCAYMDAGNNKGGWFNLQQKEAYYCSLKNVGSLESFFDGEEWHIDLYEGTYNTLNYMRSAICTAIDEGNLIENKQDFMKDQAEKREIVAQHLVPIAKELLFLRKCIPNSRLSIANQGLSRTTKKTNATFTFYQQQLIDAIAFGSRLERLKEGNYEDAKRLLFVSRTKK